MRLAFVAEGRIDAAVARESAQDWDLAAADLLVHEAGGHLATLDGRELCYNTASLRHGILVAGGDGLHADLSAAVTEAARRRENV